MDWGYLAARGLWLFCSFKFLRQNVVNGKLVTWLSESVVALMEGWFKLCSLQMQCSLSCNQLTAWWRREYSKCSDGFFFPSGLLGWRTCTASQSWETHKKIPGREYCWFICWEEILKQILMKKNQVRVACLLVLLLAGFVITDFFGTWWDLGLGCFFPWKAASCGLVQKGDCCGTRCRASGLISGWILSRSC